MKILRRGRTFNGSWVGKKVTCSECQCVFRLEKGDRVFELSESTANLMVQAASEAGLSVSYRFGGKPIIPPPKNTSPYSVGCPHCGTELKFRHRRK